MSVQNRMLGSTGLQVSEIGMGAWQLGGDWGPITQAEADAILRAADHAGVSFWDTADVYGGGQSESFIGAFNRANPNANRVIVTKAGRGAGLFPDGYSEAALRDSIEASRDRLQVDTLDLLQLHCIPFDVIQRGEVFEWLQKFKQDGLIAHFGASVETVEEAQYCMNHTGVESLQIILNTLRQDMATEVLPQAKAQKVGIIVRLGLASGLLSGKMSKTRQFAEQDHRSYNQDGAAFHVGETFSGLPFELGVDLAEQMKAELPQGLSLAEASLRWLLDFDAVSTIITGASKPEQIERNAAVSALPPLSEALHARLGEFYRNHVRRHIRGVI
ncbi:aldo/keto reductase [Reinekea blandensis]|uniref:Putative oxidoreductase protein n=1 Tax=Reinekea blandensis MED297 TaxID=314283 RepID=A4BF66_9GAMM|nr:aldo/keto reductase [Reinekea blandensis]EAR09179.1 putative oxidoreductase protein [Reinekea sp. MED297] [Reinekea blandensis MED297]